MAPPCRLLMWEAVLRLSCHLATASLCLSGSDIFASVRENSPAGHLVSHISIRVPGTGTGPGTGRTGGPSPGGPGGPVYPGEPGGPRAGGAVPGGPRRTRAVPGGPEGPGRTGGTGGPGAGPGGTGAVPGGPGRTEGPGPGTGRTKGPGGPGGAVPGGTGRTGTVHGGTGASAGGPGELGGPGGPRGPEGAVPGVAVPGGTGRTGTVPGGPGRTGTVPGGPGRTGAVPGGTGRTSTIPGGTGAGAGGPRGPGGPEGAVPGGPGRTGTVPGGTGRTGTVPGGTGAGTGGPGELGGPGGPRGPEGAVPGVAVPGGTGRTGAVPGGTGRTGTIPGGTGRTGAVPGGTGRTSTIPGGTGAGAGGPRGPGGPEGAVPGGPGRTGTVPGGTGRTGTVPGGTGAGTGGPGELGGPGGPRGPEGAVPGVAVPGGTGRTGAVPGGTGRTGTIPGGTGRTGAVPGGTGRTSTIPGGTGAGAGGPRGPGGPEGAVPGGPGRTGTVPGGTGRTGTVPGGPGGDFHPGGSTGVRLCLTGRNADWFYLDGRSIRLNSSASRVLDREVLGPVLVSELTCYEADVVQSHYRILVEILNENDNRPEFLPGTPQQISISELAAVDSVVFTVKAADADGDLIAYAIDQSSEDAAFFRIDRPNSGQVVLNRPLDYETRTSLQLLIRAQEAGTLEGFSSAAPVGVRVLDGDDLYPHFLPCSPVGPGAPVCMGPTYRANVSQADQDVVLDFFPGPIRAEDGDRGINAPLTYAILSGDDQGRFVMDSRTGEVRLTRAVGPGRPAANYTLSVMVSQVDDRLKYSVASVLVRVLCENRFPPTFNRTTFKGFIIQSSSPASIVSTFGNQVLQVQVEDQDFPDGVNPNIRYQVRPPSHLFQVIQDGVLIARSDQLRAFDRHILQVVARDEESGEEVSASVDIEVLQRGQAVPRGAFTEQRLLGDLDSRLAGGLALLVVLVLSGVLLVLVWTLRRRRLQGPQEAVGNPPDLAGGGLPLGGGPGGASQGGGLLGWPLGGGPGGASQGGGLLGRQGVYTRRTSLVQDPAARRLFLVMEEAGGGKGGGASWAEPGGGASWAEGGGGASWAEGGANWEEGGDVESQMDEEVKMDLL